VSRIESYTAIRTTAFIVGHIDSPVQMPFEIRAHCRHEMPACRGSKHANHCGNPEYEWAAEVTRWNPNVFFDLSGTLTKMRDRLGDFKKIFWWSGQEWDSKSPENNPSACVKLVFGSDTSVEGIEGVVRQYRALFEACSVLESAQKLILGGTLANILNLPK
jgi:hypothetical protein